MNNKYRCDALPRYYALGLIASALLLSYGCSVESKTVTTKDAQTETPKTVSLAGTSSTTESSKISIDIAKAVFTSAESRDVSAGATPAIVVDNDSGDIDVIAGEGSDVTVVATKHAATSADLAKLVVLVDYTGGEVHVHLQRPTPEVDNLYADFKIAAPVGASVQASTDSGNVIVSGFSGVVTASSSNGNVKIDHLTAKSTAHTDSGNVTVSQVASTNADSNNGDVSAEDASGDIDLRSDSGDITVRDSRGTLAARNSNGDITAINFFGPVSAHTDSGKVTINGGTDAVDISSSNGDLKVSGGSRSGAAVKAATDSGSVEIDSDMASFDAKSSNGDVRVTGLPAPSAPSSAQSDSGTVEVTLPRKSNFNVTAQTDSGSIDTDFGLPVTREAGGAGASMSGSVGSGGPTVTLRDSNGDIKLNAK